MIYMKLINFNSIINKIHQTDKINYTEKFISWQLPIKQVNTPNIPQKISKSLKSIENAD